MGVSDGSPSPGRGRGCEWKAGWSPKHSGPGPHALLPTGAKAWPMAFELLCPSVPRPGREFATRVLCSTAGAHARAPTACPTSLRLQALWVPPSGPLCREVTAAIIKRGRGRGCPQRLCPPGAVSVLAGGSCPQDKPRAAASTAEPASQDHAGPFTLEPGGRLAKPQVAGLLRVRPGPQAWGRVCGLDAGSRFRVALPPSRCSATCTAGSERQGGRSSRCSCRGTTAGRVQSN